MQVQELAAVFGIAIANEPRAFAPNGPLFQLLLLPTNDVPCAAVVPASRDCRGWPRGRQATA